MYDEIAKGYAVAVVNPLGTRRFAEEELRRTKPDATMRQGSRGSLPRGGRGQRNCPIPPLRSCELARLRERLHEDFASRLRRLHRAVDLGFPEFTRHVRTLESDLATTILSRYPTAAS